MRALAPLVHAGELVGLHLEGPWLSGRHCGAHDPTLLRAPDPEEVGRILDAAGGTVRMVTLAPELDHGLDAVRLLRERGVVAALGHTDARFDLSRDAIDAGVTVGTHLFNAMRGVHHREPGPSSRSPGTVAPSSSSSPTGSTCTPRCSAGRRPRPPAASPSSPTRWAPPGRTTATTSSGRPPSRSATGWPGSPTGRHRGEHPDDGPRAPLRRDVAGVPLDLAVEASSATPARVLGLTDVGAIAEGRRADLVHLDDDLEVVAVMRAGTWLSD